jgi:hypothetical protein
VLPGAFFIIPKRGGLIMKKVIAMIFSCVLLFAGISHADFIDVLSQEYSVENKLILMMQPPHPNLTLTYKETSYFPVSRESTNYGIPNGSGGVYASSSANGGVTSEYAWVESKTSTDDKGGGIGYAHASSSITFSPLVNTMLVSAAYSGFLPTTLELTDLTKNFTLYDFVDPYKRSKTENVLLSFDLSHIYTIVAATRAEGFLYVDNASLRIQPTPEPATLLLHGAGIVGLIGFRKKFRKN